MKREINRERVNRIGTRKAGETKTIVIAGKDICDRAPWLLFHHRRYIVGKNVITGTERIAQTRFSCKDSAASASSTHNKLSKSSDSMMMDRWEMKGTIEFK